MVLALASLAVLAALAILAVLACLALPRSSRASCRVLFLTFASACFLAFAPVSFLIFASASCVFALPRREAYSWPPIGATWGGPVRGGGSLSSEAARIPWSLPFASIHFQSFSVETHRCARLLPLTLTMSA